MLIDTPHKLIYSGRSATDAPGKEDMKATDADAGCWVEGHWGQYALAHAIDKANDWGYQDDEIVDIATRHLATMGRSDAPGITDDEYEYMHDQSDSLESWLNENVAPDGYEFGWHDGEFFLWEASEWELLG